MIIQVPISRPDWHEKNKVEFSGCLSTVHVSEHAYVRFADEQSQHLQNVKNVKYVAERVFAWNVAMFSYMFQWQFSL